MTLAQAASAVWQVKQGERKVFEEKRRARGEDRLYLKGQAEKE